MQRQHALSALQFFRHPAAVLLALLGFALGGCATTTPNQRMEFLVRSAPAPTLVAAGRELAAAESHASRDPATFALIGSGQSMAPLYANGTAIVVREQSFFTLRPGMAVVYRSQRGHYVAHSLVERLRDGWLAAGVNNAEPDEELVTPGNLIGVIKAAYASTDSPFRAEIVARLGRADDPSRNARMASRQ